MTRPPRNGRQNWTCPQCHRLLAYARREAIMLRRLTFTDTAAGHDNVNGVVTVRCKCGATITIRWPVVQL